MSNRKVTYYDFYDMRGDQDRMTRPPTPTPDDAPGIAAILGALLLALLAALLGRARARTHTCALAYEGVMAAVPQEPVVIEYEPWVEWVAVPAPWRNGRLLPRRHEAVPERPHGARWRGMRLSARMRGPPWVVFGQFDVLPGMA